MPGPGYSGQPFSKTSKALKRAVRMDFGILSDTMIKNISVIDENGITNEQALDANGCPMRYGILDLRMGPFENFKCETCEGEFKECPGHFGHINLAEPMYHAEYITTIMNVLRCICYNCGCVKMPADDGEKLR